MADDERKVCGACEMPIADGASWISHGAAGPPYHRHTSGCIDALRTTLARLTAEVESLTARAELAEFQRDRQTECRDAAICVHVCNFDEMRRLHDGALARIATLTAERDMWRGECASISAELDLPPGMRPMDGELRRMLGHNRALLAERDEALNELATARAVAGRAAQAAQATGADLVHIGALCGMTDDEYPLKAVQRVVKERDEARGLLRDAMALVGQYENAVESASRMYHNTQEWGSDKEIEAMFQAVYDERGRIAAHLGAK